MPVHSVRTRYKEFARTPFATSRLVGRDYINRPIDSIKLIGGESTGVALTGITDKFSGLVDRNCSRDPDGELPVSTCEHVKFINFKSHGPIEHSWRTRLGDNVTVFYSMLKPAIFTIGGPTSNWLGWFPEPSAADLNSFGLAAMGRMTAQFPEEVSLLNFIMELRELPQMLLDVTAKFNALRAAKVSGDHPRITPETFSDDYLAWHFGWSPLLGDLGKISKTMAIVKERLEHLRRTKGRWVKTGFSRKIDQNVPTLLTQIGPNQIGPGSRFGGLRVVRTSLNTELRAGASVTHHMEYLDDFEGTLRALIGTLGFTNPMKVAWNAMPFSFIADWMFGTSDYLSAYAIAQDQTNGWRVKRFCWSLTTTASFKVEATNDQGAVIGTLCEFTGQRYRRGPGLPIQVGAVSAPTPHQATLLAALTTGSYRK